MFLTKMSNLILILQTTIFATSLFFPGFSLDSDTINSTVILRDSETIVSPKQTFKLGFFTPKNTTSRYLGVFYTVSPETVIWVANRDKPLRDGSGTVSISGDRNLVLKDGNNETLWSTNVTNPSSNGSTVAQIEDTGNVVLRESSTGDVIWESFSHPSNVFLPTMKIADNVITGEKVFVSSWANDSDPEVGTYTSGLEALKIPQIITWQNGRPHWRSGPWNGQILIGVQDMYSPYLDGFSVVNDQKGNYYFTAPEGKFLMKIRLNSSGTLLQTLWNDQNKEWDVTWVATQNECEVYGVCGPFGICNAIKTPICSCMRGFEPVNKQEWDGGNWTGGCARRKELDCESKNRDKFFRMQFTKVPDFAEQLFAREIDECRRRCSENCSCVAYAFDANIRCMLWTQSLIDVQEFNGVGTDLYIRLVASELGNHDKKLIIVIPVVVVGFISVSALIFLAWCLKVNRKAKTAKDEPKSETRSSFISDSTSVVIMNQTDEANVDELPIFTFEALAKATDQFSDDNLAGKGGFGPVYKGNLENGEKVAVKRLSVASGQGIKEFMNEVILISKLQHRNLVRLLGCCVEKMEKMLVYEYMPNRSLDVCLFDATHPSRKILDWEKRFGIIEGIGRGLLYLHRDSRLRIIHRDLKPSNVLLDEDWNPKISDFGMARIFGGDQDHANTARVVGTYGYMAPEYAMEGRFSEKSDVYSFGVLMLEIIKGQKNKHYYNHELSLSLLGCAWKLWSKNRGTSFADDDELASSKNIEGDDEIVRCIQIALLCVQEFPKDRPGIQTVLAMLRREVVDLPEPEQPVFAEKWHDMNLSSLSHPITTQSGYSVNELTVTVIDGR